ncbi:hypothetical protein BEP19_06065 [Ammoniphilus oxalaticus]|uniref:DUF3679 domain-containing protein n=1 Tax=Ammoniphilus oxalaticus TaxID=66863 RepID=A0A419SJ53_9BACL|nr:DUF3679 domain-containing protein [Ammoniphilus oxalaticus]RKD23982.1 hypothetical protein BEP19_06065 [Ammoniphilus oxalaticus]
MKWRLQFMTLVALTGLLMITGIHLAEQGIRHVEGVADGPSQSFQLAQRGDGKMEMTVLGRDYVIEEETILPLFQTYSATSGAGKEQPVRQPRGDQIGQWLTSISQKALEWMTRF